MFGNSWINLENTLPLSAKVSTKIMICYFIMWLIQVPFAFIQSVQLHVFLNSQHDVRWVIRIVTDGKYSPSAAKHIFTVKSIFLPVSAFAFIGGLVHLAGGSLDLTLVNPVKPASNAAFSWAFLQGLNAIFGVSCVS
jgi:NCS1 family nucleobase:cation symporter-1